jgi:hypothetical protein
MTRPHVTRKVAGLLTLLVFGLVLLSLRGPGERSGQAVAAPPRPAGKAVAMPANFNGLEIALGLKDENPTPWGGKIEVSRGKVLDVAIIRGGPKAKATGASWQVRTVKQQMRLVRPLLRVSLDAPEEAEITVQTRQGKFTFKRSDLPAQGRKTFLDGKAAVGRNNGALRLTGKETEDDFPVLARGPDGTVWLAYVEYLPGKAPVAERILSGNFEELVPKGNGDCVRLVRFDGKVWQAPIDVTATGLDVWRPTVAVDGKGVVHVAWSQHVDGDWEVYCRRYTPPKEKDGKGSWSPIERLTKTPGADVNVVAATDSKGTVWLAWQGWREDNFDIHLMALAEGHEWRTPRAISASKANDWSPAIACDQKGNVFVAWDTYDRGNYDVRLYQAGKEPKTWTVAGSVKFEARPCVVCDKAGRVWIAYEEGDEQWGKDFSNNQFKKIGFKKNPGFALYINRTLRVKCLVDGKIQKPSVQPEPTEARARAKNRSVPRLVVDAAGGLWLFWREHPLPGGGGEVWQSEFSHYNGREWSGAQVVGSSLNLMDNRPALLPMKEGLLTVFSGDDRKNTRSRDQTDLFVTVLTTDRKANAPNLVADEPPGEPKVPVVHKNETADVARIRAYRIALGERKLRLLRGEFHRHTEFSSHRDGDGMLEDSWRYALDAGNLDWMGNGDHDNGFGSEYMWWLVQKTIDVYHHPSTFTAAMTYERSNSYPNGHRNVMLPKRGIRPLPRGDLKGTPEKGTMDTKLLYAYLKKFGGICSSHTSGTNMGTDWRDNDPLYEPVVEIYQGHRHNYEHSGAPRAATKETQIGGYQPAGYVWNALEKGYKLGFQSSSDHISTHMSYAIVLTDDASRQGVIDAFRKRHSYAATDNIILDVRSGDHLMGDIFTTQKRPSLEIVVRGTAPIARVHIIRDNKYVYSTEPKKAEVDLRYMDMDAVKGKTSYYYVRVEQADGNLAWGSPMWITWKP